MVEVPVAHFRVDHIVPEIVVGEQPVRGDVNRASSVPPRFAVSAKTCGRCRPAASRPPPAKIERQRSVRTSTVEACQRTRRTGRRTDRSRCRLAAGRAGTGSAIADRQRADAARPVSRSARRDAAAGKLRIDEAVEVGLAGRDVDRVALLAARYCRRCCRPAG